MKGGHIPHVRSWNTIGTVLVRASALDLFVRYAVLPFGLSSCERLTRIDGPRRVRYAI